MIVWAVLGALALITVGGYVAIHNRLVSRKNEVEASWRQIDVQLLRRHDLIPNLVATVKGAAGHEASVLLSVTEARALALKAHDALPNAEPTARTELATAEGALGGALFKLQSLTEAYPDLKANQQFMSLLADLSDTENRLASARRIYNAAVERLNIERGQLPAALIAGLMGLRAQSYFELPEDAPERDVPRFRF